MFYALFGAVESGIIYAIMALGVYLSFRVLDFPDLTVDGSFVTGAAVAVVLIVNGVPPFIASLFAAVAGFIAGCITGILHTKGKINALLSGILMMIALYSINLRIMGRSNISLKDVSLFKQLESFSLFQQIDSFVNGLLKAVGISGLPKTWAIVIVMIFITFAIKIITDYYLKTEVGLALRATGNNIRMIRSLSANTDTLIITGIGFSNALVAFSGGLIAQHGGFADAQMGVGMIIIGLASVIIGEALFGSKTIPRVTLAVIGGAIIYRIVVTLALRVDFLETGDMKMITAALVIIALVTPQMVQAQKEKRRRMAKRANLKTSRAKEV